MMVDETRRKNHAVVGERHNDRSCPDARKTGLFVVRLTTGISRGASELHTRRRLHAVLAGLSVFQDLFFRTVEGGNHALDRNHPIALFEKTPDQAPVE